MPESRPFICKSLFYKRLPLAVAACLLLAGCGPLSEHKKTVELSAPVQPSRETLFEHQKMAGPSALIQPGRSFYAETHNGHISLSGADTEKCSITATITGKADTPENAKKVADSIEVTLQQTDSGLKLVIDKPEKLNPKYFSIDFEGIIHTETDINLTAHNGSIEMGNIKGTADIITHNGALTVTNFTGQITAVTHNGAVKTQNISGKSKFKSHNGEIVCKEHSGDAELLTHNGRINILYAQSAPGLCNVSAVTNNGGISVTPPPGLSAVVMVSTDNGSINTSLPLTVTGDILGKRINGTIGSGQGKLHLETHNGSIEIK